MTELRITLSGCHHSLGWPFKSVLDCFLPTLWNSTSSQGPLALQQPLSGILAWLHSFDPFPLEQHPLGYGPCSITWCCMCTACAGSCSTHVCQIPYSFCLDDSTAVVETPPPRPARPNQISFLSLTSGISKAPLYSFPSFLSVSWLRLAKAQFYLRQLLLISLLMEDSSDLTHNISSLVLPNHKSNYATFLLRHPHSSCLLAGHSPNFLPWHSGSFWSGSDFHSRSKLSAHCVTCTENTSVGRKVSH